MRASCILDLRTHSLFVQGHAKGAYNIDFAEIKDRGFELPPRSVEMVVYVNVGDHELISTWFASRSERCIWKATVIEYSEEVADKLELKHAVETGPSEPGMFMFDASPLLKDCLPLLLDLQRQARQQPHEPGILRALDLGSGSGRDAIILATAGFHITGIDRDNRALQRWLRLAQRQGCLDRCVAVTADLRRPGDLPRALLDLNVRSDAAITEKLPHFHVITICRHLHRPLHELANLLLPGGLLLIHTFMEGNPRPTDKASVLAPGELVKAFTAEDGVASSLSSSSCCRLEVLRNEELPIDDGRVLSFFVARKPVVK